MKVRFKSKYYNKGLRISEPGWHDIPERYRDDLPSDVEIEGEVVKDEKGKAAKKAKPQKDEKVVPHSDRAKSYRLSPKVFKSDEFQTEVDREVVLRAAVDEHLAKDPSHSVETWNDLKEADRKKLMEEKAADLLQPLAA